MEVITIECSAFQQMMEKLDTLIRSANVKSSSNQSEEWLNGKEVMALIGITSRTLQTYRDSGLLGFTQIGRKKIFYKRADVEQLLNKNYLKGFKNGK